MIELPIKKTDKTYKINPSKIITVEGNYRPNGKNHKKKDDLEINPESEPEEPIIFPKTSNCLIGPGKNIFIPKFLEDRNFFKLEVEYRAELAIIIADDCKNVPKKKAMSHIFGFTAFNNVCQSNIERFDKAGWWLGRSLDTFGPIGPEVIRAKDIGDPHNLNIKCRLNDELKQDSNTKHMIFKIPQLIAYLSQNFTLYKGDIITTGTPAGTGPVKHGDIVEVKISEIGKLKNNVIEESYVKLEKEEPEKKKKIKMKKEKDVE